MSAQLDGHDVYEGDTVFDIVRGTGKVVEVRDDSFMVRSGQRTQLYYSSGVASRHTSRTLFWHNPIVALPHKNAEAWQRQRQAIIVFTDYVAGLGCNTASVVPNGNGA